MAFNKLWLSELTHRYGLFSVAVTAAALMLCVGATSALAREGIATPAPVPVSAQSVPRVYVIVYRPGPSFEAGVPIMQQPLLPPHSVYMRHLVATGVTLAAGPMFTPDGGLVLIRAENLEQAQAYMAADPAVTSGMFVGQVSLWRPGLDPQGRFRQQPGAPPTTGAPNR